MRIGVAISLKGTFLSQEIEHILRDLLLSDKDTKKVVTKVIHRLKNESMGRRDRWAFLSFLINAGYFKEAFELFADWFPQKKRLIWRSFLFILNRAGFRPGKDFLNYIFEAQNALEPKDRLLTFAQWEELDSRFTTMRNETVRQLENKMVSRRREMFDKLEFLQNQRMIEEEERLLNRLDQLYPQDPEVIRRRNEFQERWARHLISEKALQALQHDLFEKRLALSKDDLEWADRLTETLEECLRDHPQQAYNFSIGLNFIELYEHALIILRNVGTDPASDWLRLELLLKSRRFIECLDTLQQVESRYAEHPETTFASTYMRAHILRGLGQVGQAVELLQSIVSIRPGYRSAHSLLLEWSGGASA